MVSTNFRHSSSLHVCDCIKRIDQLNDDELDKFYYISKSNANPKTQSCLNSNSNPKDFWFASFGYLQIFSSWLEYFLEVWLMLGKGVWTIEKAPITVIRVGPYVIYVKDKQIVWKFIQDLKDLESKLLKQHWHHFAAKKTQKNVKFHLTRARKPSTWLDKIVDDPDSTNMTRAHHCYLLICLQRDSTSTHLQTW